MVSFLEKNIISIMTFGIVALVHFLLIGPLTMFNIAIFMNVDFNRSLVDGYVTLLKLNVKFTALAVGIMMWLYSIYLMCRVFMKGN